MPAGRRRFSSIHLPLGSGGVSDGRRSLLPLVADRRGIFAALWFYLPACLCALPLLQGETSVSGFTVCLVEQFVIIEETVGDLDYLLYCDSCPLIILLLWAVIFDAAVSLLPQAGNMKAVVGSCE